ncbi:MAG: hypothetical protein LBR22_05655 [Desulfovibrio sp.]|jgi:uncharacterized protein (TIGR02646 family)|nr:hypothetical protein [Desulfovibrio sp.]
MRRDNADNGSRAAKDCLVLTTKDQHNICAYCEKKISADSDDNAGKTPRGQVEHFHQKSAVSDGNNLHLDWKNMLAVCDGGRLPSVDNKVQHQRPSELSCDQHKNQVIQQGQIPDSCHGYILNPLTMPSFPNIFTLNKSNGHIIPDVTACKKVQSFLKPNEYRSAEELVQKTIDVLNLNCNRLTRIRLLIIKDIERTKEFLRQRQTPKQEMLKSLQRKYFKDQWPEFFTAKRCCLGEIAEAYLREINYIC